MKKNSLGTAAAMLALLGSAACSKGNRSTTSLAVTPEKMPRIATVDERFQSYNVEMVEVTGGRFWKPYRDIDAMRRAPQPRAEQATAEGLSASLFQQRPPIDLNSVRLRTLAAALGPAYLRISGTWANSTYFHDSDSEAPAAPPKGFGGVLTRQQWKGVVDFSQAANARIVTSFAASPGTRDSRGVWTPKEAQKLLSYTRSIGGSIAAAEFMNEPTMAALGGVPKGYDAAAYGGDLSVFRPFAKQAAPDMLHLGPGSAGEGAQLAEAMIAARMPFLNSADLLAAAGPVFDAFSYHFYGAVSRRCASLGAGATTTATTALTEDWLSRTEKAEEFYRGLRNRFAPGKPLWLTETAEAACGGNPWAATFLDSFRYLDQLGRLAKRGVQVVAHNTLAASDYGLIDENSLNPRPNYWAALLWRKLMGTTVLDAGMQPAQGLHLYAHCLRGSPGGVALLVINTDRAAALALEIPTAADRYTLAAQRLEDANVRLNGRELAIGANGAMPELQGSHTVAGRLTFDPVSITFLAMPEAGNASCRQPQ